MNTLVEQTVDQVCLPSLYIYAYYSWKQLGQIHNDNEFYLLGENCSLSSQQRDSQNFS